MKNTKNKSAFSLIIAIGLVLVMSLLVIYILEYMIPYSKNVKGIENSSNAFYQAENSIEDGLLFFKSRTDFSDKSEDFLNNKVAYKYDTTSSGNIIPYNGEGNSEFNKNFNRISQGEPIQLKVGNGIIINWSDSNNEIYFNVPDLDKNGTNNETLSGSNIINWQLSSNTGTGNTLNATGSLITVTEINNSTEINLNDRQGIDLNGNEGSDQKFKNYYDDHCQGTNSGCTLKMSVINKLELTNGVAVPYLEYQFKLTSIKKIPLRYSRIKSSGKSYGFQKYLEVRIPQKTTNQAFDFTVFQ